LSFLSAVFGGSSPNLNTAIGSTQALGGWATGQGQGDITAGDAFSKAILSGDATRTAQALAPAISSDKVSTAQDTKTNALFGGRSGGTAARNASAGDKVHSDITNLIGNLTGGAASSLLSSGSSLLNTGLAATTTSADLSQQRMANWMNSILGKGISGTVNYAESFAPVPGGGGGGS